MNRRTEIAIFSLLAVYLILLVSHNFAGFPGLHGDEAWVGVYGLSIRSQGLFSPHEMNTYTGPLYGWLLSKVFTVLPPDVFSLRLPGLLCNLLAALLMAWNLGRRCGKESAVVWLALLASSAQFALKSRVAWEAYAVQNLLLALLAILAARHIEDEDYAPYTVFGFLTVIFLGVLNHFIFLSVPMSLFIAAFAYVLYLKDYKRIAFLQLTGVGLFMSAAIYLVKPQISQALWDSQGHWLGWAALSWPLVCTGLYCLIAAISTARIRTAFETDGPRLRLARAWLPRLMILGLTLYFIYHHIALMEIWSGVAIFQRLASWDPPFWIDLPLYAWAAALLGIYFFFALDRLRPARTGRELTPYSRFLLQWPLVYAATFILLRNTNSIRYYVIPSFLLTMGLAYILPRTDILRRRRLRVALLAAAVFLNACFWILSSGPSLRRPIRFYVGWHLENSSGFLDDSALVEVMTRERICDFVHKDNFIDLPLEFQRSALPYICDPDKKLLTQPCPDCPRPPYFRWQVLGSPPAPQPQAAAE
ncbi:MAG: hypothetical protein WC881_08170 [Elusimicrobiota bacterium]|jgi:hypothetical protein